MKTQVLIVEDDPTIRRMVQIACAAQGYAVETAGDGIEGLAKAQTGRFDLIILDIGLPGQDGLAVCTALRAHDMTPVIFLTARDDEVDRILGLELGADDYVAKPFSPRELMARCKAILRRGRQPLAATTHQIGQLKMDKAAHRVSFNGIPIEVTAREMDILATLAARPSQVFSRPDLVDIVYGPNLHVSDRTLDSHLRNLRAKLAAAGCADGVETLHGVGIRMGACVGR